MTNASIPERSAVLLIDLQRDFLGEPGARMPVDPQGAQQVLLAANAVLGRQALATALVVLVVNEFPAHAHVGNYLRHGAAVAGSRGALIDPRVGNTSRAKIIVKSRASAFTNPQLDSYLRGAGVRRLYVLGVFAEGCVRATVLDALRRGYEVQVIAGAVASDRAWKKRIALWLLRRAGATILPSLSSV